MPRLYLREHPSEGVFRLDRDAKKRLIKVLRLHAGDSLKVFTPGRKWECRISRVLPDGIELTVLKELPSPPPSKLVLILAQAIPKGEKFEWLIQKSTELGVSEIFPLITERTVVRPAQIDAKVQRWNEIAEHAAGQCESANPSIIHPPETLKDFLTRAHPGLKLLLHEREGAGSLRALLAGETASSTIIVVGPEGGWTSQEMEALTKAGFRKIHLGSRILRAETAGLALAAILQYQLGDFSE